MEFKEFIGYIVGPSGGLFGLGCVVGGVFCYKYIAPLKYGPTLKALENDLADAKKAIAQIEAEFEPYKKWRDGLAEDKLKTTRT